MGNLKLGVKERYDISDEIIKKYNIKVGGISPFTRLVVVNIDDICNDGTADIKKPSKHTGTDIKKISKKEDIDIKKISSHEEIDIKKMLTKEDVDKTEI